MNRWDKDREKWLRRLVKAGLTKNQIAKKMGASEPSIVSKIKNLGLEADLTRTYIPKNIELSMSRPKVKLPGKDWKPKEEEE